MPAALIIRHVHFEDLGVFSDPLKAAGYDLHHQDAGGDTLELDAMAGADLLVVLGGPVGAYEEDLYPFLQVELDALRLRLAARTPTLGVCLGAQLMARALGARVAPGPHKEIGWAPITLTEAGRSGPLRHFDGVPTLHWHGDNLELPSGAERLAHTSACANQAFAIGQHALGFQFHPEVDGSGFERWLIGHACEIAAAGRSVADLRADARRLGQAAGGAGRACLAQWIAGLR